MGPSYQPTSVTMASTMLVTRPKLGASTDVGSIWEQAIVDFEAIAKVKLGVPVEPMSVDMIVRDLNNRKTLFGKHRHDGSKLDKLRTSLKMSLDQVENLGEIITLAAKIVRHGQTLLRFTLKLTATNLSLSHPVRRSLELSAMCLGYVSPLRLSRTWS